MSPHEITFSVTVLRQYQKPADVEWTGVEPLTAEHQNQPEQCFRGQSVLIVATVAEQTDTKWVLEVIRPSNLYLEAPSSFQSLE